MAISVTGLDFPTSFVRFGDRMMSNFLFAMIFQSRNYFSNNDRYQASAVRGDLHPFEVLCEIIKHNLIKILSDYCVRK